MELKLTQFVSNLTLLTNIHNQNKNPIFYRIPKDGTSLGLLFYCSYTCPRYVVLPINAIWIDMDPESNTYGLVFQRTKKHPTDPYQDVWTKLYFYADATVDQTYDPNDMGNAANSMPPLATSLTHGVGYLSYPEATARVILDGDDTLTNNRDPRSHTHPEKPASMLSINGTQGKTFLPIKDQNSPALNQIMVVDGDTVQWRLLKEDELAK